VTAEADPVFVAFSRLAELSGDGLVIVDAYHRCLYVNPSGCSLLGATEAELRGRDFIQQFPAHERGALATYLASSDSTHAYRWSSIARRSGDREHAFEYAALPCTFAGEPAVAVMLRDVTEHRELERRATALAAIGASMAYAGSLEATLEGLARQVVRAIGIQACLMWVFDEERKRPFVGGTYGLPAGYVTAVDALWQADVTPPSTRAFESRQIVVDRTYRQRLRDPAFAAQHEFIRAAPWDTLVYVPLIYREEAVGTLVCYYPAGADPGQAEISFLNAVAVQAAAVVENARLADKQRRDTEQLSTLLDIAHNVASTLELRPLLELVLDQLKEVVPYDGAAVLAVDGEGEALRYVARRAPTPLEEVGVLGDYPEYVQPIIDTVRAGKPVIIDDVRGDGPLALAFRMHTPHAMDTQLGYIRSWMGIPMTLKERWKGVLLLSSSRPDFYTERHARMALAVAQQAAVAIENARLYERAQEAAVLEERQRLSRELHDSVSQALYSIALGAKTAHALLPPGSAVIEPLEFVLAQTGRGLAEMRALIFELRPEALEQEGLAAALQRQIDAVQARHQIVVMTTLCEEPDVPLAAKEAVYRIAQEALHNIVKHANARSAEVRLENDAAHLTLDVSDDGAGFDPGEEFPGHLGLRTMRERAMRLGGTLEIESRPSAGTRVRVHIPTHPHG
jgi:PAS domain S-box-containing protein